MKIIDDFLNNITMYRLVLYYLIFLLIVAAGLSLFNILPFNLLGLLFSITILVLVCWSTNTIFAKVFQAPTNLESVYISALILALIITPMKTVHDLPFLFWAGIWAMASKYILAINKKHLFNPVAFAVTLTYFTLNSSASWWVGTAIMMPFVLVGGLLIVRKIRRFDLVFGFFLVALLTIFGFTIARGADLLTTAQKVFLDTPILFFAFVMLTEPLTSPPTESLRMIYGGLTGFLFAPQLHFGGFYTTPEIALLLGNMFSYLVSPKQKLMLTLKEKLQLAPDIFDFVFSLDQKFSFTPGQYMEWTLAYPNPDSRGNRRYFTLASSPTEDTLRLGVKFYPNPSGFKKELANLSTTQHIVASQLAGDFTLPKDANKKLVFIAGGIGVTPFRSIVKYLIDTNQKRDIILFYSNKTAADIVYKDVFDTAYQNLGIRTIYVNTDTMSYINQSTIEKEVPDYKDRKFYISGPRSMIVAFENTLKQMGIPSGNIKTDFFPGFA